ncbi:MAG TPA: TRAP transporter substrate-binding protein DctP [Xanthobacteraceae bacterium]
MNRLTLAGLATLVSIGFTPPAAAQTTWKYSSWTAPNAPNNRLGTVPLFDLLAKATNGTFTVQNFMGAQLFNNRTTLKGVADGLVDAGTIVPAFTPAELKHNAIITDAPALFTDGWASTGAANEALFFNCPECWGDFEQNKTITLGVYSPGQNYMQCVDDIRSAEDLRGRKVAGVSSMTARWAEVLGQARQQIGPGDLLPALQRRQVDCTMSPLEFLVALSLKDVVRTVVEHPLGAFPAVHLMIVNKGSWAKLSAEHKAALIKQMPPAIARVVAGYNDGEAHARREAMEKGAKFIKLPAIEAPWQKFVQSEENVLVDLAKARGVPESTTRRIVAEHVRLVQKWKGIMDKVGRTRDALATALWDEVFSKLKL